MSSGKSTLVGIFKESGARVVSADRIGHRVLEEPAVRDELVEIFGPRIIAPGGRIDRRALGRLVFASAADLARLNAVSHPRLLSRLRRELGRPAAEGFRGLVVLEAALLVEWDLGGWCDQVVAVTAPAAQRLERAVGQHGLGPGEAADRLNRQLPDEVRVRYADHALVNDGTLQEFRMRASKLVEELWAQWRAQPDRD
jgi:dephospho-CoA kinase